jgi:hypothetical protein
MTYSAPPPHRLAFVAAGLCVVATVLTVLGAFLDLFSADVTNGDDRATLTVDAWGFDVVGEGAPFGEVPTSAPPIIVAAIVLAIAAAVAGYTAVPGAAPVSHRIAGLITVSGTAFLAGVVWTVVLQVSSQLDSVQSTGRDAGLKVDAGTGAGYWLLLAAVVLAIAAVVVVLMPRRLPAGEGWMRPPRYGDYLGPAPGYAGAPPPAPHPPRPPVGYPTELSSVAEPSQPPPPFPYSPEPGRAGEEPGPPQPPMGYPAELGRVAGLQGPPQPVVGYPSELGRAAELQGPPQQVSFPPELGTTSAPGSSPPQAPPPPADQEQSRPPTGRNEAE